MPRCFCLSTRTDEITSLHQITSGMVVLYSTTVVLQVISNCMCSLTTLPLHCRSTVFTDVTSPTKPTLLAKRTLSGNITAGTYACSVTRQRYRGVVKSSAYRSATTKCTGTLPVRANNFKLPTVLLFVEFTMALAILT